MTPTDQDLEQIKKLLDIMDTYGLSSLEVGPIKAQTSPHKTLKSNKPPVTVDDKEQAQIELRERLQEVMLDEDLDLYYST